MDIYYYFPYLPLILCSCHIGLISSPCYSTLVLIASGHLHRLFSLPQLLPFTFSQLTLIGCFKYHLKHCFLCETYRIFLTWSHSPGTEQGITLRCGKFSVLLFLCMHLYLINIYISHQMVISLKAVAIISLVSSVGSSSRHLNIQ